MLCFLSKQKCLHERFCKRLSCTGKVVPVFLLKHRPMIVLYDLPNSVKRDVSVTLCLIISDLLLGHCLRRRSGHASLLSVSVIPRV